MKKKQKINIYLEEKIPDTLMLDKTEHGRPVHKLQKNFLVWINNQKNCIRFCIYSGIEFDYASIPRPLWSFCLPSDPKITAASLVHDVAYGAELWPRKFCDQLFLAIMKYRNVPAWKRTIMYSAVRIGGGFTYKEHTNESVTNIRKTLRVFDDGKRPLWKPGEMHTL